MLGLINRALQCFLRDTYGPDTWARIACRAEVGVEGFEPLLIYDDALIEAVLQAATEVLARPRDTDVYKRQLPRLFAGGRAG